MIQLSFQIKDASLLAPGGAPSALRPPLRLEPHPVEGARVTGVWPAGLAEARRAMATFLAELPPSTPVVDLLLGLEQPAAAAADRLAGAPTLARCLLARHCEIEGTRWIRLFGLYQLGRADLIAGVEPDIAIEDAYRLLSRLGEAHLRHEDRSPMPSDRPVAYGYWLVTDGGPELADDAFWDTLRARLGSEHLAHAFDARMVTPAPRFVLEADDVSRAEPERWRLGVSRAVRTSAAQAHARARFELGPRFASPNANDAVMVCSRIEGADGFFAYREPAVELPESAAASDSGWRFACLDPDHHHDEASTRIATLSHLSGRFPALVQYLGLPPGWVVTHEQGRWWVTAPGSERSYLDRGHEPGPPWEPAGASSAGRSPERGPDGEVADG